MFVMLLTCVAFVSGETSNSAHFVLNAISNSACNSDVYLYITSLDKRDAGVDIHLPQRPDVDSISAVVRYSEWTKVALPPHVRLKAHGIQDNGIKVNATSPIGLHLMEPVECGGSRIQFLPITMLGTHYILQNRCNYFANTTTEVSITASKDNTEVAISLLAFVNNSSQRTFDNLTSRDGETTHIKLDSYQTMLFKVKCEIFRIDIKASASVAVLYLQDDGVNYDTGNQLVPVSRWGNHFILFPLSQKREKAEITAAENGTNVLVTKNSETSDFLLSTQSGLDIDLPAGESVVIQSEKPVMVIQQTEGECTATALVSQPLSMGRLIVVPSVKDFGYKYILSTPSQDKENTVTINLVLKGHEIDNILLNGVALSNHNKQVLNKTFYGISGEFSLYRLQLLLSSGTMEYEDGGFLILSHSTPLIHPHPKMDYTAAMEYNVSTLKEMQNASVNQFIKAQGIMYDMGMAENTSDSLIGFSTAMPDKVINHRDGTSSSTTAQNDSTTMSTPIIKSFKQDISIASQFNITNSKGPVTEINSSNHTRAMFNIPPSLTPDVINHTTVTRLSKIDHRTSPTKSTTVIKPFKSPSERHLNDILKHEAKTHSGVDGFPSVQQPSGLPFVVKQAKKRDKINVDEVEWQNAWLDRKRDDPGLDITVTAVIVSLASALILVIVVVFGFLVAEMLSRRERKVSLSLCRVRRKRRIGDYGSLIKDDFEMFPCDMAP